MIITTSAYARAGLIGNPSDGYFGKTISIILKNFAATVTLYETPELVIELSQQDHSIFNSIHDLALDVRLNGYYGGVRLIKATIKRFWDYCSDNGICLKDKNFTIRYETTVPRQVGLAGSSGIITATLRALMKFYGVRIPKPVQPTLILSVENKELGISAGLQDRVAQVYEGVVFMDFSRHLMEVNGRGEYEPINPSLLPPIYVAYRTELAEGSEVFHNNIRSRFDDGDTDVVKAMSEFAELAQRARDALIAGRPEELGHLMDANFDLRSRIYRISPENSEMVNVARSCGATAKFAGSSGTIIGTFSSEQAYADLSENLSEIGCKVMKPIIE